MTKDKDFKRLIRARMEKTGESYTAARANDRARASEMEHRAIADHVYREYAVSGWWAQMITVAYERFRGLRDVGQRRGGGYDVNKSKMVPVPVGVLWRAFEDDGMREAWLPRVEWTVRTATEPKSMRVRLAGDARLDAYFTAKGDEKSSVSLQQRGIPDKEAAEGMKAFWAERLEELKTMLAGG